MPDLMRGKKTRKKDMDSKLSLCLIAALLFFLNAPASFAQTVYNQTFPFTFEYKYKKEKTRTREGVVTVTVQYGKRGSKFGFVESPGQSIDFSDIPEKIIQVQILSLQLDSKGKNNALKHPLIVDTKKTGVGLGTQQLDLVKPAIFEYFEDSSPAKSRMEFRVVDNGKVNLEIPFGMIPEDKPFEKWTFDNGAIRLRFNVTGIVKERKEEVVKPVVDQDKKSWDSNKNSINGWLAYIGSFPGGKYLDEALRRIENYDQQNWKAAINEESLSGYENYLKLAKVYPKYAKHISAANRSIDEIKGANESQQKERTAWKNAQSEDTRSSYLAYLEAYPDGRYEKKAREKLQLLIPMKLVVKDLGNGKSRVRIKNAINPRYKDASLDFGLKIDDSDLRRDSVLMVSYLTGGRYKIVVEDEYGKRDSVTFDNQLEASMALSRKDSTKMLFSIKKGIKPYKIDLIHGAANTLAWSKDSIFSEQVEIPIAVWQDAELGGEFNVEVWDAKSWKPVQIVQKVSIPEVPRRWGIPFIIAAVLGVLVFLTGIFFLVKLFLDRRQKNFQYQ